jgi:hypothetical protein
MRRGKGILLLCMGLTAAVVLFGSTVAKAQTSSTIAGWNVVFENPTNNTFVYKFTQTTGDKISFVEILLPVVLQEGSPTTNANWPYANIEAYLVDGTESPLPYELIFSPTGDGSTGFGIGLRAFDLIKLKSDNAKGFSLGSFTIKMVLKNQTPPTNYVLAGATSDMLLKTGNGQVWDTGLIDVPDFVLVPPPPPIGIDTEYISVEGHPDYVMALYKDLYGSLERICLAYADNNAIVKDTDPADQDCCTTGGVYVCDIGGESVELNLGELGSSVIMCTSGSPSSPSGCGYVQYGTESEQKSGDGTCGWKFNGSKYAYTCW